MLLRIVAVSVVMTVCASEAVDDTFNCTATEIEIFDCLHKPEQNNSLVQFRNRLALYNMPGLTTLLKKLKQDGCIEARWRDVQAWIKLNTPPKAIVAIYKNLSKEQKTLMRPVVIDANDEEKIKKLEAVSKVVNEKLGSISVADMKEQQRRLQKYYESCFQ